MANNNALSLPRAGMLLAQNSPNLSALATKKEPENKPLALLALLALVAPQALPYCFSPVM